LKNTSLKVIQKERGAAILMAAQMLIYHEEVLREIKKEWESLDLSGSNKLPVLDHELCRFTIFLHKIIKQ
jgi:hypothetical protein